jgi:hypothetical protein
MENASWSCVNGLCCGFFAEGGRLFLIAIVERASTDVFCRFAGRVFSPSSFLSRARFLDVFAGEGGTGRSGELDETDEIVLVRLLYVFLTVAAMASSVGRV